MNLLNQIGERISRQPSTVEQRALLERLARLNARDGFTLTHALSIAAERFDHDAQTFEEQRLASVDAIQHGGRPMFTPAACEQFVEQFKRQAADVRELIAVIEGDDDEEEEQDAA